MLLVNGEKMSKSLGNFFTIRDVLGRAPAEAVRLLLLRTQYRAELDFSDAALAEARRELDRFYRALERHPGAPAVTVPEPVMRALSDDLNTPLAISALHVLADAALAGDADAVAGLRASGLLLGLFGTDPTAWFRGGADGAEIEQAIAARLAARQGRDFVRADAIRSELAAQGIVLEDGPGGKTTWRRAP